MQKETHTQLLESGVYVRLEAMILLSSVGGLTSPSHLLSSKTAR